jgi:hypothetical protein
MVEFLIGMVIGAGILYCFLNGIPDTYKQIRDMFKSGFIFNDDFEE